MGICDFKDFLGVIPLLLLKRGGGSGGRGGEKKGGENGGGGGSLHWLQFFLSHANVPAIVMKICAVAKEAFVKVGI